MRDSSDIPEPTSDKTAAPSDEHPPWTIRDFPPDSRAAAIAAAKRDKVKVSVWIDAAIREKVQAARRLPAVKQASNGASDTPGTLGIDELERLSAVVAETARAGGKASPPKMRGLIYRHVQARLALAPPDSGSSEPEVIHPAPSPD